MVQRFAERKYELILEEQAKDIEQKEEELRELDSKNMLLQLEVTDLGRNWITFRVCNNMLFS